MAFLLLISMSHGVGKPVQSYKNAENLGDMSEDKPASPSSGYMEATMFHAMTIAR